MGQIEQNLPHCTACHLKLETEQNYCSNCGQKIGKKSITVWSIIADTFSNYLSFERSGLATIYTIISKPKFIVDNYCQGNRGFYASPGKMIIFSVVLMALHLSFVNKHLLRSNFEIVGVSREYGFFLFNFIFFVIASQLTFITKGFKIARHFVSVTYNLTAFLILFLLFDNLCLLIGIKLPELYMLVFMVIVLFWNSLTLTQNRKWWMFLINFLIQIGILILLVLMLEVIFTDFEVD